jgi:hypothetical protein
MRHSHSQDLEANGIWVLCTPYIGMIDRAVVAAAGDVRSERERERGRQSHHGFQVQVEKIEARQIRPPAPASTTHKILRGNSNPLCARAALPSNNMGSSMYRSRIDLFFSLIASIIAP